MSARGRLFVVGGVAVAGVLVWLALRAGGTREQQSGKAPEPRAEAPPPAEKPQPPPQTPEARERYAETMPGPVQRKVPEPVLGTPPPLTAFVLRFPDGTSPEQVKMVLAKCGLTAARSSGLHVRAIWNDGEDPAKVRQCLKWEEVQVSEERDEGGGAPPR